MGTFVPVFGGCGCCCGVLAADHVGFVGVALAVGLALPAMIHAIGPVSGAISTPR